MTAGGHLSGPGITTTVDNGGTAQTTFLTAPYTPQGSNIAQQTQFVINSDGSVNVSTINRPDLAANTSQAPTRAPVGVQQMTPPTRDAKEGSTASAPDVCAKNPNSIMCADMGNADYEDPIIPDKSIDLSFKPENIFSDNGICPQPVIFSFMHNVKEFSFEPACDGANRIRPIVIAATIVMCGMFVFSAVKEL